MYQCIEKLRREHVRLERLVVLLNSQPYLRTDSMAPNIGLLVDALVYLTRFPDVTHHVIEDRMVEKLLEKNALSTECGREIEAQHVTLIRDGRDLLRDLEAAIRGGNMSQELVDARIRLYAERLHHNMAIEELTLFPAAEKYLSDADWRAIEAHGEFAQLDPLFDGETDARFADLYQAISAEAKTASVGKPLSKGVAETDLMTIESSKKNPSDQPPVMSKKVLDAEQIRHEVHKRICNELPAILKQAESSLPMPKPHVMDDMARNWDIEAENHPGYERYVRRVVDEARKEFFISDATDRDENLGDSFAHD